MDTSTPTRPITPPPHLQGPPPGRADAPRRRPGHVGGDPSTGSRTGSGSPAEVALPEGHRYSRLERPAVGRLGEDLAAQHLSARGWHIVDRNFRVARGELDIVAVDGATLVFVEVKTRRTLLAGYPQAAVTPEKVRRLRRLAGLYLLDHSPPHRDLRIDVLAVLLHDGEEPAIEHVTGVGA